jgi:tRNA (cytidine/uridine-2'-O-)-methyltransferase
MPTLNIVLIQPQIPQNTGNIAPHLWPQRERAFTCRPLGFSIDDKAPEAWRGLDYWHLLDITHYENVDDFFEKNSGPFFYFSTKATVRYSDAVYPEGSLSCFRKRGRGAG